MATMYTEGESAEPLLEESTPYTELQVDEGLPPRMPKVRTFLLNFTQFGLNFLVLLLSVEIVPAQVEKMVGGGSKGRTLGGMVAGGAIVTFVVSPLVGMISDRISSRVGKRRPVMWVGALLLCGGLVGMAFSAPEINVEESVNFNMTVKGPTYRPCAVDLETKRCRSIVELNSTQLHIDDPSIKRGKVLGTAQGISLPRYKSGHGVTEEKKVGYLGLYIVFFLVVISSQAIVSVPFNALVADISHPSQRGFNSGVMGAMILLGNICGAVAGISFTTVGVLGMYCIIISVLIVCVIISSCSVTEQVTAGDKVLPPLSFKVVFFGFWAPLKEHDFRWVFITRFLMQQGVATITGFLEYWLGDMIPLPNCWTSTTAVALLLLPLLCAAAVSSLVFGVISDKTGYRKVIIASAAFTMGIGSFVLAFLTGLYAFVIAGMVAFIIGLGFGAYQSVDFALVMDVLPEKSDKAKDIAVWHQALVLPQALATPIGGFILDCFEKVNCKIGLGYILLFITTSVYFILSGVFVFKIRRVR